MLGFFQVAALQVERLRLQTANARLSLTQNGGEELGGVTAASSEEAGRSEVELLEAGCTELRRKLGGLLQSLAEAMEDWGELVTDMQCGGSGDSDVCRCAAVV